MPVQVVSPQSSPSRPLQLPRLKAKAAYLLRHGYSTQTSRQLAANSFKQHNSHQVPSSLPEDVLHRIFFACVHMSIDSINFRCGGAWSWIVVSQVCSSWRTAALSCQDLWRYIDFSDPRSSAITLERAKMSPLHIHTVLNQHNSRLIQRTLQLAHRIQDIHIKSSLQDIYPLLDLLTHPNPAVQSLIVDVHIPKSRPFGDLYIRPLFPTSGPPLDNLRYMELHSAPFYLLTPRCTHLTQFHLHDLPMTERPTVRYFLFMLGQLQHLEHLTIDRSFPINLELVAVRSLERCALPKLKSISLIGATIEIVNMLECLLFPPSTCVSAKIWTLSDSRSNIWKLSQWISSRDHVAGVQAVESLVLTGKETGTRFVADSFDLNPEYRQSLRIQAFHSEGPALDVVFEPYERVTDDDLLVFILTVVLKSLSLAQIHSLSVQDLDFVTQKSWTQLLRAMPLLRVLDIVGSAPSGLAWALLLNARLHEPGCMVPLDGGWNPGLLVPRLTDIYLRNVDCSSGGYMLSPTATNYSYYDLDDSRFLDVMNAGLCERRQVGVYLRSLSIVRCEFVLKKSVDDARTVVAHLVCDVRRLLKEEDVDESRPARYRNMCKFEHPLIAHYYRLHALAMDSDF